MLAQNIKLTMILCTNNVDACLFSSWFLMGRGIYGSHKVNGSIWETTIIKCPGGIHFALGTALKSCSAGLGIYQWDSILCIQMLCGQLVLYHKQIWSWLSYIQEFIIFYFEWTDGICQYGNEVWCNLAVRNALKDSLMPGRQAINKSGTTCGRNCRIKPNIRRTKSQNLNDPCLVWQLSLPNPLKPG